MEGVEYVLGRMLRHASSLSGEGGRRNLSSMVKVLNMGPGGAVVVVTWIFISYDLYGRCVFFNFVFLVRGQRTHEGEVFCECYLV